MIRGQRPEFRKINSYLVSRSHLPVIHSKHRSRARDLDICADILQVARAGVKKTQIVYQAILNFKIVKGYLQKLIANGMLNPSQEGRLFVTTNVGVNFLERYRALLNPLTAN